MKRGKMETNHKKNLVAGHCFLQLSECGCAVIWNPSYCVSLDRGPDHLQFENTVKFLIPSHPSVHRVHLKTANIYWVLIATDFSKTEKNYEMLVKNDTIPVNRMCPKSTISSIIAVYNQKFGLISFIAPTMYIALRCNDFHIRFCLLTAEITRYKL